MSTKEIIDLSKHRVLRVIYYFKAISSGRLIFSKTRTYGFLRDYYTWEEVKLILKKITVFLYSTFLT